jgi:hypothetical protein
LSVSLEVLFPKLLRVSLEVLFPKLLRVSLEVKPSMFNARSEALNIKKMSLANSYTQPPWDFVI